MDDINITLEGLLSVVKSAKPITVNLFNEESLLLITFNLEGYQALDDFLCDDEVLEIEIKSPSALNIKIDTSKNS